MSPFENRPLSISLLSVTLGLERPPAEFGITSYSTVLLPDWLTCFGDYKHSTPLFGSDPKDRLPVMCVVDYGQIDSDLGSGELYPVNIVSPDRLENWADLDTAAYDARCEAWLAAFIRRLDAEWPGLAGSVTASTVSTARSMHDHLNTPGGATYGFAMVPPKSFPKGPPLNIETAVEGLWISSSFAGFGGFTGAIGAGIAAARGAMRKNLGGIAAP